MAIQTYNKDKIDELFALRYVANTSLIKDLDLDDYEDKAIIINQENGKQYQLDKSATATAELGKWEELASDVIVSVDTLPTSNIKTNCFYYLKASTNDYSKGVYHAIKNADNTYTWDKVGKELYIQKTTDYVELDGKQYPKLTQDQLVSYYCYAMFKEGKKVLVTYNETDYYEVINAEWFSGASSAETRYVVEYICDKWLIKTGRMGNGTFEEHYDLTSSDALVSVDALPTIDIKTNVFYRLKADTADKKKGVYYATKNADSTYTWTMFDDDVYVLKATNTITLDGVVYPTLRGDVNFAYRCYENFKAGKTVFVTYDEKNIYEVFNAEFDESGNVPSAYVEYICGNWLIKTGTNSEASTFEEHYNLVESNALESVDALPTSDIKTNIFYRLNADTTDNKKGIYYAVKNSDNTYTWTMVDDDTYIFKATKYIGIEGIAYPSLEGDVNYAYRCYENFKAGKTVLLTYDEKNYYRVNSVKYYEDGGAGPNVFVEYLATYWLVTTGATSSLHTYATYSKFITQEALTTVAALPTSDIHTNIFYRLTTDTAEHPAGIYYAVKNADNTYTWKAVGGGGGGGAVLFTMTQVKNISGIYTYYPTVAQFKEILDALTEGKDVWVTSISSNHYMSKVTVYRQNVPPYADFFTYDWDNCYRTDVYQVQGEDKLTVVTYDLGKTTEVIDNLISTDPYAALSAKQGNKLYQTKLGFVNDLTATTIADLWTWANGEETKDFLKLHQRTFKFSTSSECPKGTSTSDVFVATIYTNTANYGYIRAINYNTGVEYNNYNNNGTWSGWWNSSFEANKHQSMTRATMWALGDGVYTNVTWASSDYPIGVTSTGTTTTVMVTGNTAHNYGTLTCFEQGSGRISICSVQNNVVKPWREVVSNYGTGTFNAPSGMTVSAQRMSWYDVGNTRIVHLTADMKGISISAHSGKSQSGFSLTFDDGKKFFVNNASTGCVSTDIGTGLTITVNGRSSSTANNDFAMNFFNAYTSSFSTSKTMSFGITLMCTTT